MIKNISIKIQLYAFSPSNSLLKIFIMGKPWYMTSFQYINDISPDRTGINISLAINFSIIQQPSLSHMQKC